MVVQQNNWREIPQLLELAKKYRARTYLSQLVNWGTFSKDEYQRRAVHLPGHSEHSTLKKLLAETGQTRLLELGNLRSILSADQ